MKLKNITFVISKLLIYLSFFLAIPLTYSLFDSFQGTQAFLITISISLLSGIILNRISSKPQSLSLKEGFLTVTLCWTTYAIIGGLPYMFSQTLPNFIDVLFESMSGFTTTGATVIANVEIVNRSILLWRSMTQLIGGMGIVVVAILILPELGLGAIHLFDSETSTATKDRIMPRIKDTAKILLLIYVLLNLFLVIALFIAGMPLFDAINHSMTTISTGGFSIKNNSLIAYKNPAVEWIISLFMFMAGINLTLYFHLLKGRLKKFFLNTALRAYMLITSIAFLTISLSLYLNTEETILNIMRYSLFNIISILTTTGFANTDYLLWPQFGISALFFLMFIGAMAGSTTGALKTDRLAIMFIHTLEKIKKTVHPNMACRLKFNNSIISNKTLRAVSNFFFFYIFIFAFIALLLTFFNIKLTTAFSATAACLGNIGPGLGEVGPLGNYSQLPSAVKLILTSAMLIGRLEIYTVIVIFTPRFWKN